VQLASQQEAPALQLLLAALLEGCSTGKVEPAAMLQQLQESHLQLLLSVLCCSTAGMSVAEQLVALWLAGEQQLPLASAVTFLNGCGQFSLHLQPPAAGVALGLLQQAQLETAADSNQQHADKTTAAAFQFDTACAVAGTQLVARICQQLCQPTDQAAAAAAAAAVDAETSFDTSWFGRLSSPAAAVALFSCWAWPQQQQQLGAAGAADLLLQLYHASRQAAGAAKPRLTGLLLDLGLAAAGRAEAWQEGERALLSRGCAVVGGMYGLLSHHFNASLQLNTKWQLPANLQLQWWFLLGQHCQQFRFARYLAVILPAAAACPGIVCCFCRLCHCVECSHHPSRRQEQQRQQQQQAGVGAAAVRGACCAAACAAA
jgi:hypothetical protein